MDRQIESKHLENSVRLPFKVDCRDFSAWLGGRNPFLSERETPNLEGAYRSLESFLATQIESASGGAEFSVSDLHAVLKLSALLIVFDGLDEVADIRERKTVVEEITKGIRRIQELAASLQTVVTSRPTVFANSPGLPRTNFIYLQLGPLDRSTIRNYADKWVRARHLKAREARDVKSTLNARLDDPHLRDIARNPMQLTILLSLIHRKGTSLPDKRTALYDAYVNLFFDREAEKSEVVRERRELLIDIHRYIAWIIHSEAQTNQTGGAIAADRLEELVRNFLKIGGHDIGLAKRLFAGTVERVMALVARIEGSYEFEVQPMREYFAARYLYDTAPYSPAGEEKVGTLPERFEALARDFFWHNVTRFYAGCYSQGELPSLLISLNALSNTEEHMSTCYPQALAITLLSDYTFAQYPLIVEGVVDFVLNSKELRRVAAAEQYARRSDTIYLPRGSGQEELIERCFDELRSSPEADYAQILLEIIRMNSNTKDRVNKWKRSLASIKRPQALTRWIYFGARLGILEEIEKDLLDSLLGGRRAEYGERAFGIAFSGMWNYIEGNAKHMEEVIDRVLDRYNDIESSRTGNIIDAFVVALSLHRVLAAHRQSRPTSFMRMWDRHQRGSRHPTGVRSKSDSRSILDKCESFIHRWHELSETFSPMEWVSTLGPWQDLCEHGRLLFGDRWAFLILANAAAGVQAKGREM